MSANPTPKTSAQRMADHRQRRAALGLVQLNIVADKRDHEAIKAFAAKLQGLRIIEDAIILKSEV